MQSDTTDDATEAPTRKIIINEHDADGRPAAGPVCGFEVAGKSAELVRETRDPRRDPVHIQCDRESKTINKYCYVETTGRSRSNSASSMNHHDRLLVLVRDGDDWTAYNPNPRPTPDPTPRITSRRRSPACR